MANERVSEKGVTFEENALMMMMLLLMMAKMLLMMKHHRLFQKVAERKAS